MWCCVVDFGNAYRVRAQLQASTHAAATAAADQLPDPSLAVATAHAYSGEPGGRNAIPGTQDVQLNVSANCNTSPRFCNPANTITVDQSANVQTYFLGLIGIDTIPVKVHAQACSPCAITPLDVMIVLDRTGSMGGQKIQNAEKGVEAFLGTMDPQADNVGLAILPPAKDSASVCSLAQSSNYDDPNAPYVVVPLSNDYETGTGALDSSSRRALASCSTRSPTTWAESAPGLRQAGGGNESPPILANEAPAGDRVARQLLRRAAALVAGGDLPGHLGRPRPRLLPPQRLTGSSSPALRALTLPNQRRARGAGSRLTLTPRGVSPRSGSR
jgi:hypothetical protein